jgi:prepilin-type N-terminal cleavage/methylation domain-containing protein
MMGRSSRTGGERSDNSHMPPRTPGPFPRLLVELAGRPPRGGFTLIETIVAIAAVALVAVGLASIFDAVGKTVKGGKRVSLLNQYAGLVENQMRKDFSRMTRDGFLEIRHEWADKNHDGLFDPAVDAIPLHPDDVTSRPRRCDQILFFSTGKFETSRQPVHPDVRVTSDTAMIYYGHGQRRREDSQRVDPANNTPVASPIPYLQPKVDDNNADDFAQREARLGVLPAVGGESSNPNYYPAGWTLVRHATLLVKPMTTSGVSVPSALKFGPDTLDPTSQTDQKRLRDYDYQIGLQPAARSVFRALNRYYPSDSAGSLPADTQCFREPRRATLASGIVDVASSSLREIKSVVEGFGGYVPSSGSQPAFFRTQMPAAFDLTTSPGQSLDALYLPWSWTDPNVVPSGGTWTSTDPGRTTLPGFDLDMMHVWMEQAFPGETSMGPRYGATAAMRSADPWGVRMRVEPQPVDLIGTLGNTLQSPAGGRVTPDQQVALERMDQLMLAGNGFLPHCSEFQVEWSYGLIDPVRKETIWYGPASRYDSNGDGVINASDKFATLPYPYSTISQPQGAAQPYVIEVPRLSPKLLDSPGAVPISDDLLDRSLRYWQHSVTSRLIYGYEPSTADIATTAHFGYVDPTYKQDYLRWSSSSRNFAAAADGIKDYGHQVDLNNNGVIDTSEVRAGEPAAVAIPWAWPKMIRVTITLSDAQDPSIENSFQFIFSVPTDPPVVTQQ